VCDPGGSGEGTTTKRPLSSATARKCGSPSRNNSTVAPGAARPAMTLSPFGSTRTMSNDGAIGAGAAGARGGSLPTACCRRLPASGPVRAGGLEAAGGKGIPAAGPASCAFCPGSGGALTVPNQLRRETRPTVARTAMAARPRGRRTNWLTSSITLTRHHRVRRVNSGASRRRVRTCIVDRRWATHLFFRDT
jgi:hypothetical protein